MRKSPRDNSNAMPVSVARHKNELLEVLQTGLIPSYKDGSRGHLILGLPPMDAPGKISIFSQTNQQSTNGAADPAMKPFRFPRFAFVIEGEADLRVGQIPSRLPKDPHSPVPHEYQVASLPAGNAIVVPAGVPMDTVSTLHWFRPEPEKAASKIFWIIVLPDGMLVHTCTTQGFRHERSAQWFIKNSHLLFLTELLVEELELRRNQYETMVQNCLLAIFCLIERALLNERVYYHLSQAPLTVVQGDSELISTTAPQDVFRRACNFIEAHVHEPLTPANIAQHAAVSPAHLNRIFRQVGATSVMRYVASHRIGVAQLLLKETQLPVNEIATIVGIPDHAIFNRTFRKATGHAPSGYRKHLVS